MFGRLLSGRPLVGGWRFGGRRRGVPGGNSQGGGGTPLTIVAHGDSITSTSYPAADPTLNYTRVLKTLIETRQGASVTLVQRGLGGASWDYDYSATGTLTADAPTQIDPYAGPDTILILFAGTNGLKLGTHTAAAEYADFEAYLADRLTAGFDAENIIVLTMLPRESFSEVTRTDYNNLLVAGAGTYGYSVVRLDLNTDFGIDGQQHNTTWYPDTIHPTVASNDQMARLCYDALYSDGWTDGIWSPVDLPSLSLWLDASDTATLTLSGSLVDAWADKSGAGKCASVTSTGTSRPSYSATGLDGSRAGITIDNSNDFLENLSLSGWATNISFGFVGKFGNAGAGEGILMDFGDATGSIISGASYGVYHTASNMHSTHYSGTGNASRSFTNSTNAHVISGQCGNTQRRTVIDGSTSIGGASGGSAVTPTRLRIGRALFGTFWLMNGVVSEVICCDFPALTAYNRQKMEAYLKAKWGVA